MWQSVNEEEDGGGGGGFGEEGGAILSRGIVYTQQRSVKWLYTICLPFAMEMT